jgi:hypothetical protein
MRPRHRYVPSLDALPLRLVPCTMPVFSMPADVPPPAPANVCGSSVATTTVDPTLVSGPAPVRG